MRIRLFVLSMIFILISGCASTRVEAQPLPTLTPLPAATFTPEPDCSLAAEPNFSGYAGWSQVNPKPIKGHEVYVNVYVNNLAREIYLSASGENFPVCAMIVKTHLANKETKTITAVTVMVKMPPGYDPENHDWWWGMYDKDGINAEMNGRVSVCIACHKPAASADYVFSQKVIEESRR